MARIVLHTGVSFAFKLLYNTPAFIGEGDNRGVRLQLTGLASGFDWSPVVDQLIELERIPQKRHF